MNFKQSTIIGIIAICVISCCTAKAAGYCKFTENKNITLDNVADYCKGSAPSILAKIGENGKCESLANECMAEQLNCIRYRNGEECKLKILIFKIKFLQQNVFIFSIYTL